MDSYNIITILLSFYSVLLVAIIRLLYVLPSMRVNHSQGKLKDLASLSKDVHGSNIMLLLGSGGHTGEMMRMLSKVDITVFNRTWVTSSGDSTSIYKVKEYEEKYLKESQYNDTYLVVSRARAVGESFLSSIISTIKSFLSSASKIYNLPALPSVLILNGPGTSVALAYVLFFLKYLGLCKTKIIYVESLARVSRLSVSGYLLLPIADRFIVQWKQLYYKYKRSEYYGILI